MWIVIGVVVLALLVLSLAYPGRQAIRAGRAVPARTRHRSAAGRLTWTECTRPLYPVDGYATQIAPGQVIQYRVPDMLDRPWAKIWEEFFEKNMDRPKEELDLGFK